MHYRYNNNYINNSNVSLTILRPKPYIDIYPLLLFILYIGKNYTIIFKVKILVFCKAWN